MRPVMLCILLLSNLATPANAQQLKQITNSIGMKLVLIPSGSFKMGAPEGEMGRQENETPHEVTISKSYYLGVYEVTQEQYEKVLGKNPSSFKGPKNPLENVSWEDAVSFCKKLSAMPEEKEAGKEYRLPTEAEWEYACRADNSEADSFGKNNSFESLGEYAWFSWNRVGSDVTTHRVGEKKTNQWGLYDMHGNVGEWCQDWFGKYPTGASTDPHGPNGGSLRVLRGGCWDVDAAYCRSAFRVAFDPDLRALRSGFRVALSPSVK